MACLVTSRMLLLLATSTLLACGGETFSARDEAIGGEAGEGGSPNAGRSGSAGSGGAGASGGSAQAGSAPVSDGGVGGRAPTAGSGSMPAVGGSNAGSIGSGGDRAGSSSMAGTGAGAATGGGGMTMAGAGADAGASSAGLGGTPNGAGGVSSAGGSTAGSAGSAAGAAGGSGGMAEIVGGCGQQLFHNAAFDAGPSAEWRESSTWSSGLAIIVARGAPALMAQMVAPDSGNYLAWLGGIPDNEFDHHVVRLEQDVVIPEEAALLTFTGKVLVKTEEPSGVSADVAYLEFALDDDLMWQAKALTNRDAETSTGWSAFSVSTSELDRVRGRTLTFVAYSRTDPLLKTSFWLDSLRLEAVCDR